ncbi:hypothetical protein Tco_0678089 [Tanacetum coccineum]|uniref:Uncharacterized protein n=1 Tax=Tanacetum coccineum TaxID=301880 RepID=A0ABQ4XE10_9ASTR
MSDGENTLPKLNSSQRPFSGAAVDAIGSHRFERRAGFANSTALVLKYLRVRNPPPSLFHTWLERFNKARNPFRLSRHSKGREIRGSPYFDMAAHSIELFSFFSYIPLAETRALEEERLAGTRAEEQGERTLVVGSSISSTSNPCQVRPVQRQEAQEWRPLINPYSQQGRSTGVHGRSDDRQRSDMQDLTDIAVNSGARMDATQRTEVSQQSDQLQMLAKRLVYTSAGTCREETLVLRDFVWFRADKIPDASGVVFALTRDQAANTSRLFSDELPRIPPYSAMLSLTIELIPELSLSSKAPYRIGTPFELKKLKEQLQEVVGARNVPTRKLFDYTVLLEPSADRVQIEYPRFTSSFLSFPFSGKVFKQKLWGTRRKLVDKEQTIFILREKQTDVNSPEAPLHVSQATLEDKFTFIRALKNGAPENLGMTISRVNDVLRSEMKGDLMKRSPFAREKLKKLRPRV